MPLNPPRSVRAVLYLLGSLGIIAVQWANDKHWLDSADRTAAAALLALVMLLATANTVTDSEPKTPAVNGAAAEGHRRGARGAVDAVTVLVVAVLVVLLLVLLGFLR